MKLNVAAALLLFLAFTLPSTLGPEGITAQSSDSPLYEYRYNQALEGIGLANQGSAESKMSYGSISTSSLNPRDTTPMVPACQSSEQSVGYTCPITCNLKRFTCAGYTCAHTCAGGREVSCSGTCPHTCAGRDLSCINNPCIGPDRRWLKGCQRAEYQLL